MAYKMGEIDSIVYFIFYREAWQTEQLHQAVIGIRIHGHVKI